MTRLVVVGGGPGGTAAATNAIQYDRSTKVTMIHSFEDTAYSPCGMPYAFGREVKWEGLFMQKPEFYVKMGIDLRLGTTVTRIDIKEKAVYTDKGDKVPFDKLVIATGWAYEVPHVPGNDLDGIWYLKNPRRAMEMDKLLDSVKRVVVYKAKPLAIELATAMRHRNIEVTVVDELPWLAADFVDPEIMKPMQDSLERMGAKFQLGTKLIEIKGQNGKVTAVRTSEGEIPCDVLFVAGPAKPDSELARSIGVKTGTTGGCIIDDHMRTNVPDVYAVGGCCEILHAYLKIPIHMLPSTFSYPQGRIAGINAVGGNLEYYPIFGPWAMIGGEDIQVGGVPLPETMLKALHYPYMIAEADGITAARYHPVAEPMHVKLMADPKNHRIIGAEFVGGDGTKERADFIAFAMRKGATLEDIATMENVYSPALGALNEPMALAAKAGLGLMPGGGKGGGH